MDELIFGVTWDELQALQHKRQTRKVIDTSKRGDTGSDPLPDGTFRMFPSGDIVDLAERDRRLKA